MLQQVLLGEHGKGREMGTEYGVLKAQVHTVGVVGCGPVQINGQCITWDALCIATLFK